MKILRIGIGVLFSTLLGACSLHSHSQNNIRAVSWQSLIKVSPENGHFTKGVSACFAGNLNGYLYVAGGCNFPDIPAAEGGKKVFYDDVYVARIIGDTVQQWKRAGSLLVPTAYGVSFSVPQGVICVGGVTPNGSSSAVYRLEYNSEKDTVLLHSLPSLPYAIDNMAGAVIGDTLYIVGGNVDKKPSSRMFALNLGENSSIWHELPPVPGNHRIQPVCAAVKKAGKMCLFIAGGFASATDNRDASLNTDAYCYEPDINRWTKIAEPCGADGQPISLGGGVAVSLGDSLMLCMGGVNKDIFLDALKREQALKKAVADNDQKTEKLLREKVKTYMNQPPEWYKFNKELLVYSPDKNEWTVFGSYEQSARAGATAIYLEDAFYLFGGELKPGIRTFEIWRGKVDQNLPLN